MKIININTKKKELIFERIESMLEDLKDYDIIISLSKEQLQVLLEELFNLYQRKKIIYEFEEDILRYFNEIIVMALEEKEKYFSYDYVKKGIIICQSILSPVEISSKDIKKVLIKSARRQNNGTGKYY